MATAVVMPWPTSARGSRTTTWLAAVTSRTSISSSVPVTRTSEPVRAAGSAPCAGEEVQARGAATVRVVAATEYTMNRRRDSPAEDEGSVRPNGGSVRSKRGLLSARGRAGHGTGGGTCPGTDRSTGRRGRAAHRLPAGCGPLSLRTALHGRPEVRLQGIRGRVAWI